MSSHPGVTKIEELLTYDYGLIFSPAPVGDLQKAPIEGAGDFFKYFANPIVPIVAVLLYLTLSETVVTAFAKLFAIQPKGAVDTFVKLHNALLAAYSFWVCFNTVPMAFNYFMKHGYRDTVCSSKQALWNDAGFDFWIFNFYISKYYEFIDTWIHYVKGKRPSFLQVFHHAGIVILNWVLYVTYASPSVFLVCFNSFIHTLMYTYYADSATFRWFKPYMTSMQIVQLVVGTALTIPTHFSILDDKDGNPCLNQAQNFSLFLMESYTITLAFLFWKFYQNEYIKKREGKDNSNNSNSKTSSNGIKRSGSQESLASSISTDSLAEPHFKPATIKSSATNKSK